MLGDLNKLITLYKKEVQDSKTNPKAYTSSNIDISRQAGFIEERYIYKNDTNLVNKILARASANRLISNPINVNSGSSSSNTSTNRSSEAASRNTLASM